jgi:hypothetical protein
VVNQQITVDRKVETGMKLLVPNRNPMSVFAYVQTTSEQFFGNKLIRPTTTEALELAAELRRNASS